MEWAATWMLRPQIRALVLSADMDWTALEEGQPMRGLMPFCDRTHAYNNYSDDALKVSEWTKNTEKRLGRHGPRDLAKLPERTLVVDATKPNGISVPSHDDLFTGSATVRELGGVVKERLFDHWGYLYREALIDDIVAVLKGVSAGAIPSRIHREGRLYGLRS